MAFTKDHVSDGVGPVKPKAPLLAQADTPTYFVPTAQQNVDKFVDRVKRAAAEGRPTTITQGVKKK